MSRTSCGSARGGYRTPKHLTTRGRPKDGFSQLDHPAGTTWERNVLVTNPSRSAPDGSAFTVPQRVFGAPGARAADHTPVETPARIDLAAPSHQRFPRKTDARTDRRYTTTSASLAGNDFPPHRGEHAAPQPNTRDRAAAADRADAGQDPALSQEAPPFALYDRPHCTHTRREPGPLRNCPAPALGLAPDGARPAAVRLGGHCSACRVARSERAADRPSTVESTS
jgi:hypothetical protein